MGDLINNKTIQMGIDGLPNDDVSHFLVSDEQLHSFGAAQERLSRFTTPMLFDRNDPHSYFLEPISNSFQQ